MENNRLRRKMRWEVTKLIFGVLIWGLIIWSFWGEHQRRIAYEAKWDAELQQIAAMKADLEYIRKGIDELKAQREAEAAAHVSRGAQVRRLSLDEVHALAGVVHAEAKGEPVLGKMLVAKVAINRLRWNPGLTMQEILTRPDQFAPAEPFNAEDLKAVYAAMADSEYNHLAGFHNPDHVTDKKALEKKILLTVGRHDFW